jgi:hypothetical protein
MTYGPIDFLALEFEGNKFNGDILPALLELVEQQIVRIIDLVIIVKDADGNVAVREMQQLDPDALAVFDPLGVHITGMITSQDIEMIGEALANNSTAGIMLFENLWAVKFKDAVLEADGRVVMQTRIPHEVVAEALAEMEGMGADALSIGE